MENKRFTDEEVRNLMDKHYGIVDWNDFPPIPEEISTIEELDTYLEFSAAEFLKIKKEEREDRLLEEGGHFRCAGCNEVLPDDECDPSTYGEQPYEYCYKCAEELDDIVNPEEEE